MIDGAPIQAQIAQPRARFRAAAPLLIVAICLPVLLIGLAGYPALWFDEGFKLNSARLLAEMGIFGSRSAAGVIPFDMSITSGPIEVGVMALSYKLFGLGITEGRAPIALFALTQLICIYLIVSDLRGREAGLMAALFTAAIPPIAGVGVLLLGRQALAEAPAAAMILVGFWMLLQSWRTGRASAAVLAGAACGIGLLSKSQFAISLMPTLALIGAARWLRREENLLRAAAPTLAALAVFFGWSLMARLGASPEVQRYNSEMLGFGISTLLITDLVGTRLTLSSILLAGLGVAGAGYGLWRLWPRLRQRPDAGDWMLATLATLAALHTFWFVLVSVGWPRYSYIGYVAALPLLGMALHELLDWGRRALAGRSARLAAALRPAVFAALALLIWVVQIPPALAAVGPAPAEQMASYIERELPRSAVIESWEWEIDALGAHTRFAHPHQRYVYEASYQVSRTGRFDLDYDLLHSDPDYLLAGPFSDWTGIYPQEQLSQHFVLQAEIGPYRLYRRLR